MMCRKILLETIDFNLKRLPSIQTRSSFININFAIIEGRPKINKTKADKKVYEYFCGTKYLQCYKYVIKRSKALRKNMKGALYKPGLKIYYEQ